ncbi:MAG: hypothetical protein H7Y38_15945 [Armatimonadetes bacterium]|nr:hypothetical protein [Armatimonadota bacterium]
MIYLLDTNALTALRHGNPAVAGRVLATSADQLAISVITVEEELNGWYPLLRRKQSDAELADVYSRIAQTVELGQVSVYDASMSPLLPATANCKRQNSALEKWMPESPPLPLSTTPLLLPVTCAILGASPVCFVKTGNHERA